MLTKLEPHLSGTMDWIADLPGDRVVRWAAVCMHWRDLDLSSLRMDRKTALLAMKASSFTQPGDRLGWKRLIADQGREAVCIFSVLTGSQDMVHEILQSGECMSLSELAVKGSDFPDVKGKALGRLLYQILQDVIENPELNKKEKILKKYKNSIDYCY